MIGWLINLIWKPSSDQSFQLSIFVKYLMKGTLKAATAYIKSVNINDKQQRKLIQRLLMECKKHQICQFKQTPSHYEKLFHFLLTKQYVSAQGLVSQKQFTLNQRDNWFRLINQFKDKHEVDGDRLIQFLRNLTSMNESKWEEYIERESHQFSQETSFILKQLNQLKAVRDCEERYQVDKKKKNKQCSETLMNFLKVLSGLNFSSNEAIYNQIKDEQAKEYLKKIANHLSYLKQIEESILEIKMHLKDTSAEQSFRQINDESSLLSIGTNTAFNVLSNIKFIRNSLIGSPKLNKMHSSKASFASEKQSGCNVNFDSILKKKLQERLAPYSSKQYIGAVTSLDSYDEFLKQRIRKQERVDNETEIRRLITTYTEQLNSVKERASAQSMNLDKVQTALKDKSEQLVLEKEKLTKLFDLLSTQFQKKKINFVEDCEKLLENVVAGIKKQTADNKQLKADLLEANQSIKTLQAEKINPVVNDDSQEIQRLKQDNQRLKQQMQTLNQKIFELRQQNEKVKAISRDEKLEYFKLNSSMQKLSSENAKLEAEIVHLKEQLERQKVDQQNEMLNAIESKNLRLDLSALECENKQLEQEKKKQTVRMEKVRLQIKNIKQNLSKIRAEKQNISELLDQNQQALSLLSSEQTLATFKELLRRTLQQIIPKINILRNSQTEIQVFITSHHELFANYLSSISVQILRAIEIYGLASPRNHMSIEEQNALQGRVENLVMVNRHLIEQITKDYRSYFNAGILFENRNIYKAFLVQSLEANVNCSIFSTRLLYKYDKMNKSSFHQYVDNIPRLLLLIETEEDYLISAYIQNALNCEHDGGCSLLMSLTESGCFQLKPERRAIVYDDFYFILGNSDLRVKVGEKSLYSNLGMQNSFFQSGGINSQSLFGRGRKNPREALFKSIEFYQVNFTTQRGNN